ncbi:MAG: acetylxylan esterase, partial [Bacteroidales bacterium]|nr:acetylxylan esterase [Bacteroidales bacterium]
MKIKFFVLLLIMFLCNMINAQMPEDVFRKPLKEVLTDVEKRYDIKLQYSEDLVKDLEVSYATWRYRMDTEETLANILLPFDLVYQKTADRTWQISRFSYYQRSPEEGRKHLEKL